MGEFAWASYEPVEGRLEFAWMDRAIAVADRCRIQAILATPTASVPPWLRQHHPDVLGGNEKGPFTYGGRKGYCTNSPAYLDACARITTALAKHYGQHPGVIGWQLDNEPGIPFLCSDANCLRAFRAWLRRRYGTLDALDKTWNDVVPRLNQFVVAKFLLAGCAFKRTLVNTRGKVHYVSNSAHFYELDRADPSLAC
jgi:beta-galactosidase